jgi:hypothetical protein
MRLLISAQIFVGFVLFSTTPANANSVQQVRVAVKVNVYAQPAFKSKLIERLNARTVISFSTNKIVGKGGLGVFYKVKTPNGKIGYIIDSDLIAAPFEEAQPAPPAPPVAVQTPTPSQTEDPGEDAEKPSAAPPPPAPIVQINTGSTPLSYWGAGVAAIDYTESVNNQSWHQTQYFFAIRRTRAARQSLRFGNDFTVLISPQAPRFLAEAGASGGTSGLVTIGDLLLTLPLSSGSLVPTLGIGPMGIYSSYKTNFTTGPYESSKFRFGGIANVGLAYEGTNYCLRLDLNYYFESASYMGQKLTFQSTF